MAQLSYSESMSEGSGHGQGVQAVPFKTSNGSLKVLLLHGNLDIWVKGAKNLPNMDIFHNKLDSLFGKLPGKLGSKVEEKITSDPYVTVSVSNAVIARTYVIRNSEDPVWMQHFYVPVAHQASEVHFVVKDNDIVGSQIMGAAVVPVEQLYSGGKVEGEFPILNSNRKQCKAGAVLILSIQYTPMQAVPLYYGGVGADPEYRGVPGTYFPLRRGGRVTLYQDAHVPEGSLPNVWLDNGVQFQHGQCWNDIYRAISGARKLIYIAGWSVHHLVRLVRDGDGAKETTLGDLLKIKSQEGVRVLLLVWDDPTSNSILGYKTETGTIYTHHQKTVIVDADAGSYRRNIIAFVGGLDLCKGRYDTPNHPIFSTLHTVHKDDYHNPNFTGNTTDCPREPWHDLHCRIEGPAAYDVLKNFEDRWLKASKRHGIQKVKASQDDALLKLERISEILGIADAACLDDDDPESWHVQIFRSIDSNSVKGFPKDPKDATAKASHLLCFCIYSELFNLMCGKNVLIDMSIHTAYVKAIRAAQHFIYIENQYFLGSSFNWNNYKDLGANNLIPMEIALKIANKIRSGERFAAYIVVPMWPEGVPTSTPTQRILFWQYNTMQMMYEVIYKALVEVALEKTYEPQDYLNFFCLGTREAIDNATDSNGTSSSLSSFSSSANTPQALSQRSRRFMIYVHSKGMIVDDEFVILGSANINQRSLEGTRDTEIAMGGYQPDHTWANKNCRPHGQIYGYRMSLWAEHLATVEACFEQPESVECVRRVRAHGEHNWRQYAAEEVAEMKGHLLKYPVEVDKSGKVNSMPGCPNFPDIGGKITGTFLGVQENLTI
ncbi:hypothetical protein DM860_011705 [Cuscuta australis]|uniref:Phospholipase D n=1 Tax=Cuscuta australis TaxID=267555 RepID=A0A328DIG6_9ASTE|nr:hypothetical protein DM860_011705 [Cuscuta australis]